MCRVLKELKLSEFLYFMELKVKSYEVCEIKGV